MGNAVYNSLKEIRIFLSHQPHPCKRNIRCTGVHPYHWGIHEGEKVPQEVALLQRVQHVRGVIKVLDHFSSDECFYMVMELIPSAMSIYDYIKSCKDLPIDEVKRLFKNIVRTIKGCLKAGVSHKDIKPDNILIYRDKDSDRLDIKVIDFGCGEFITR
ncbi:serine/threonine-protein kinase pim-3-like [Oratosquilla oratoria]|uniref:serine/threonine-protein kinase pim-3-like n=1 Tax=Oratosquilla oratoria TaxID=337810 RepID=UPI003F75E103